MGRLGHHQAIAPSRLGKTGHEKRSIYPYPFLGCSYGGGLRLGVRGRATSHNKQAPLRVLTLYLFDQRSQQLFVTYGTVHATVWVLGATIEPQEASRSRLDTGVGNAR